MPELAINKFLGIVTAFGRDERPLGALDDIENYQVAQTLDKLTMRTGYNNDLAVTPTDVSTLHFLNSVRFPRGVQPATEVPTAQYIQVICGAKNISADNVYFQRPFWHKNNGTIESTAWLWWGEFRTTTINGAPAGATFVLTAGDANNDYYNGWIVKNDTRSEMVFVTDYVGATKTITAHENIPTDWANTDSITLYRHFHDNPGAFGSPGFLPLWTDPIVLKQGNDIVASGGQGSAVGYKAIWSGYINKTFFNSILYQQTYVSEAELKTGSGFQIQNTGNNLTATNSLEPTAAYRVAYVLRTDDGQMSVLLKPSADVQYISVANFATMTDEIRVYFSFLNKRFRYVDVFMAQQLGYAASAPTPKWEEYFYIQSHDMTDATWSTQAPGAGSGYFHKTLELGASDWNGRGEDLVTYLGHTEPNRTTSSFSYGLITKGRLLTAKYYDYNASLNYNDQINFTPISSDGVPQYNKLLNIDDVLQSTVEAGDPSTISGMAVDQGQLVILKTRGVYSINLGDDPSIWQLVTITKDIGSDAPDSIITVPEGVIFAKSANGVFLVRNNRIIEISRNFRPTFRALSGTYASQWWAWYDAYYRSYRFMVTTDGSNKKTFYECFLGDSINSVNGLPPWTKHIAAHNIGSVSVRSDGRVYFAPGTVGANPATFYFDASFTDDDGTAIGSYFDTGDYSIDEKELALFQEWWLTASQAGGITNVLDATVKVNGTTIGSFTTLTGTGTYFRSRLPIVGRIGNRIRLQWNSNATRAGLGTSHTVHAIGFPFDPRPRAGDKIQQL